MTFLKKLRDAAMECSNVDYRLRLRQAADDVEVALGWLHKEPTEVNMRAVIGFWANAERIFENRPKEGTPSPISGSPEPARLAA